MAFAKLYQGLAVKRLRGVDVDTIEALRKVVRVSEAKGRGSLYHKRGSLDSDPLTRVQEGCWQTGDSALVFVVMVMQPKPGGDGREASAKRLSQTAERLLQLLLTAGAKMPRDGTVN